MRIILNVAPLYHVGGTDLPGYGIWHVGGCMVLQRRFEPAAVLRAIPLAPGAEVRVVRRLDDFVLIEDGTALELAGTRKADPGSLQAAFALALELSDLVQALRGAREREVRERQ